MSEQRDVTALKLSKDSSGGSANSESSLVAAPGECGDRRSPGEYRAPHPRAIRDALSRPKGSAKPEHFAV